MSAPLPKNLFKAALKEGRGQIGIWNCGGPMTAEMLAAAGYDWVVIDTEHTPIELVDTLQSMQAIAGYPEVTAVVRPVENSTALIKRVLDMGGQTVLVPYVQSVEEAQAAVDAMFYAPKGVRGVAGMHRGSRFGTVANYAQICAQELCLIVQVETVEAMDILEDIAAVDGVDAVFFGPSDLAASMGYAGQPNHPAVQDEIIRALGRMQKIGKPGGLLSTDPEFAQRAIDAGAGFTAVAVDTALLMRAALDLRVRFKGA